MFKLWYWCGEKILYLLSGKGRRGCRCCKMLHLFFGWNMFQRWTSPLQMKILPVALHFLKHALIWVPRFNFKKINRLLSVFFWLSSHPRIAIRALQEPVGQGGLVLPDLKYLAGQMVFSKRRLVRDGSDAATELVGVLWGFKIPPFAASLRHPILPLD